MSFIFFLMQSAYLIYGFLLLFDEFVIVLFLSGQMDYCIILHDLHTFCSLALSC
jgi:hypothetical protein